MERRDFLRAGAAGALAATWAGAGASGCGGAQIRMADHEAEDLLARLEHGLQTVRNGASETRPSRRNEVVDRMVKLGMEALVVADVARSIPANTEVPAALRERLIEELPVLDRATASYSALLREVPRETRRHIEEHMRSRPDFAMDIAGWIDARAGQRHISHESRMRLRSLATQVTTRVNRQSMAAMIDDTLGKVERIVAHHGAEVAMANQAGADAMMAAVWRSLDDPRQQAPEPAYVETEPQGGAGDEELIIGGVLMGSGVAVFGIATLISALAGDVLVGLLVGGTVGGILLIIGLIVLIVGIAENA